MKRLFRYCGGTIAALLGTMICCDSRAEVRLPVQLQAQLVSRLATFDRNFKARSGSLAYVLVVHKGASTESEVVARNFAKAIGELGEVGGVPSKVEEMTFSDGPTLAARCRAQHVAMVYFSIGLEPEMRGVAANFVGVDVLTVGASAQHAENGAVVGFDLEEARPKIVLNLRSTRAQNISFKAELLKLARIVQ